jgi:hypothetical protein
MRSLLAIEQLRSNGLWQIRIIVEDLTSFWRFREVFPEVATEFWTYLVSPGHLQ